MLDFAMQQSDFTKIFAKYMKMIEKDALDSYEYTHRCLEHGIIIDPIVPIAKETSDVLIELYGIDLRNANATFYETFQERQSKTWGEVLSDRLLCYIMTYGGLDAFFDTTFIPNSKQQQWQSYFKNTFTRIRVVDDDVLLDNFENLLAQPLALPSEDVLGLAFMVVYYGLDHTKVRNKELQIYLALECDKFPSDPELFVRCLVCLITNSSEYFKNKRFYEYVDRIGLNDASLNSRIKRVVKQYIEEHGIEPLANHFRPNKKFWLLLKRVGLSKEVNQMKRMSDKSHISHRFIPISERCPSDLSSVNNYQLIRWMNYLYEKIYFIQFELDDALQFYRIRNGKVFVKPSSLKCSTEHLTHLMFILDKLIAELVSRFSNREFVFYYPDKHIDIKLPTSGKSFIGNYPTYTSIRVPDAYQVGVYWNQQGDIDLHGVTINGAHVGFYSEQVDNVTYTGDMTRLNDQGLAAEALLSDGVFGITYSMNPYCRLQSDSCKIYVADSNNKNATQVVSDGQLLFQTSVPTDKSMVFATSVAGEIILSNLSVGEHVPDEDTMKKSIEAIARKSRCSLSVWWFALLVNAAFTDDPSEATHDFSQQNISLSTFVDLLG